MSKHYVYILVRKDLSNSQRVVQSSHVAWEIAKNHNLKDHPSMIIVGIRDEGKLIKEAKRIEERGFNVYRFYEPLFDNKLSSIAIMTDSEEDRSFFKRYNLLSDESFYTKEEQSKIEINKCVHTKLKPAYRETLTYEFSPTKICTKCQKNISCELTELEKIYLVVDFFENIDISLSEEEISKRKDGFNL